MVRSISSVALLRAFTSQSFVLIWSGQTFSRVGDFLYQVALAWWLLEKTGSASTMAAVMIFSMAPMLLFLLIGGVAVDRYSRIHIMLISDLVRGLVVSLIAVLAFFDRLEIWHLYSLNILFGLVDAFFHPAYAAVLPESVPAADLSSANSLSSLSMQAGRILGPALGAGMVMLGGTALALACNGLTFFIAATFLVPLVLGRVVPAGTSPQTRSADSAFADLRAGIATVLQTPWLWITILLFCLINVTLAGPYSVALPFLVKDTWQADVATLGLLYTIFPIGYVLGGVWLGSQRVIRQRGFLIYGGAAVAGLMLGLFGFPLPLFLLCIAALLNGAALEMGNLAWINALQEFVPQEKLGRVSSVEGLGSFALIPIGYGITGWATDWLGAPLVFSIGGGLTALIAIIIFVARSALRSLD